MQRQCLHVQTLLLSLCFSLAIGPAFCDQSFWQEDQHKAIELQRTEPAAAIEMYRLAIKDAAAAKAPVEKQLTIALQCGDLLYYSLRQKEADEIYQQGLKLSESNHLKNWQARFLLMISRNNHEMVKHGLATTNDPAPALKALELRPGDPNTSTDFKVNCLAAIGDAYMDSKNYAQAEKYLADALQASERLPNEQNGIDEITRSFIQLRIDQHKYSSAAALLVASAQSHPSELNETKYHYMRGLGEKDPSSCHVAAAVGKLIRARDFAGLDAYANQLRLAQKSDVDGTSPIDDFMDALGVRTHDTETAFKKRLAFINDWIDKQPKSVTAKVALANVLTSYAWHARGTGYADSVTDQGWLLMGRRLDDAWKTLYRAQPRTPDWYSAAQRIALGKGWEREQYETLVAAARKTYPNYNSVMFSKAYWLQPKWYGKDGEAMAYVASECNRKPGTAGDILYAQFAWNLDASFFNVIEEVGFDWARVRRGFMALLKQYPQSLTARGELAYLGALAGDKATALAAFPGQAIVDAPIHIRPKGYFTAIEDGQAFQKEDKRPEAITAYSRAIALDPQGGEGYYHRAEMYLMTNREPKALNDINKCLSMFPAWPQALAERSRIENIMELYDKSIEDIEKMLAVDSSDPNGLSTLGHDYDALGNHQKALDAANYQIEITEQKHSNALYYSYMDRGLVYSNAHQYEQAVSDLAKGIQLRREWSQLWAYLAYVYAATDQMDKAEETAKTLLILDSFPPRAHRLCGEMYRAAGMWERAIVDYEKSTSLEPTYGPGFWQQAVCELALGRYDKAEADLQKSVALTPTSALAYSWLALSEDLLGKTDIAQTHIAKAFELTPNLPMNFVNRARIELHHGELARASADCDKALSLDQYSADAYATAAAVLTKAEKHDSAQAFEKTAKAMWWHPWQVPIPTDTKIDTSEVAITLPTPGELKPQPFSISIADAAP